MDTTGKANTVTVCRVGWSGRAVHACYTRVSHDGRKSLRPMCHQPGSGKAHSFRDGSLDEVTCKRCRDLAPMAEQWSQAEAELATLKETP